MTTAVREPETIQEPPAPQKEGTPLKVRLISGGILTLITLALIWSGVLPFACQVIILAMVGLKEYFGMLSANGHRPARRIGTVAALTILLGAVFLPPGYMGELVMFSIILVCITTMLRAGTRNSAFLDGVLTTYGVIYLGWMFSFLLLIRRLDQGAALITMLTVASAFTDMGGFFVGRSLGRIKLYPLLSPKKTVEGAIGAIIFPMAACWFTGWLVGIDPIHRTATALLVGVVGQLGDLWESALKREMGVKDSGTAIAGHGGALDRFDSLSFAAPLYYLYCIGFIV